MAEILVPIESLKERVTRDREEVSGPIDVAVIRSASQKGGQPALRDCFDLHVESSGTQSLGLSEGVSVEVVARRASRAPGTEALVQK